MKKKFNPDNIEESKLCPFCMGELSIDATKCNYCGEKLEEDREGTKERLRREGEDTGKREVRRQIQDRAREKINLDKLGKSGAPQKGASKSVGLKSWWAVQSTGDKALVVLCVGVVAFSGIYLASGISQGTPYQLIGSNSTSDVGQVNQSSSNSSSGNSNNFISAAKAKSIASKYLASDPKNTNFAAGSPSLRGSIYYVSIVIANDHAQGPKGTHVGYVKVDAKTGAVLGIQTWDIETNEPIEYPPATKEPHESNNTE